MSNSFFRFKQFTISHDHCAMKVGTDGVLLGAWVNVDNAVSALDIGTGTGLIALMIAQRNPSLSIEGIDLDKDAICQAEINRKESPFKDQISNQLVDINQFDGKLGGYDIVVSNPPFFYNSLKSPNGQRTLARHTDSLQLGDLVTKVASLLSSNGRFSLIYPYEEKENILNFASLNGLHSTRITNVYPTPRSHPKRILVELSKESKTTLVVDNLIIETDRHQYSEEFTSFVKDFYLKL